MASSRSIEIRFWWPLTLATIIWLIIVWGFGFFLTSPEVEIATPPPIETRFLELPESKIDEKLPAPRKQEQTQPPVKTAQPSPVEQPKPEQKLPADPGKKPKIEPPIKPRAIEKVKPEASIIPKEKTLTETPPRPRTEAATDLSDYIKQAQARRGAKGIFDGLENSKAATPKPQPSEDEIRMAKIKRNLQAPGTSGVFKILRIGSQTAEFSFRAWTTGMNNPRLELIEVDAGPGGDVERAIIRRMIQLIRQYHQGNFNWESYRLNRVIVLSARPEDSTQLENFLMLEFFGGEVAPYMR